MAGSDWDVPMTLEELEELDVIVDDDITIYPYPYVDDTPYRYTYDYLLNYSEISLEKYNQDTGKRYEFVELEEVLMHCSLEFDRIRAYFKARRPGDVIVTTFVATTYCPRDGPLADPHPESIVVVPWPDSAASSQYGEPALSNYSSFEGVLYCKPHFDQLFKMTGSLDKSFEGTPKTTRVNRSSEQGHNNSKVSSMFGGTQEKCVACKKTVYPLEQVAVDGTAYHRACFKCSHGGCVISPSNYVAHEHQLYCKHHHSQLFKAKGNFSQLDKHD